MALTNSGSRYLLWSGTASLRFGNSSTTLDCRVYQQTGGKGDLSIESDGASEGVPHLILTDDLQLDIPGVLEPLSVFVTHNSLDSAGKSHLRLQPKRSPCWYSKSRSLRSCRMIIVNFGFYWIGSPVNFNFVMKGACWIASFIAVSERSLKIPNCRGNDDFRITHQVEISHEDGSLFTEQEARDFVWKLSLFLSFCRGQWVGQSLMVGLDESGEMALEQWGTGRVSRWRDPSGWLDEHHGNCIGELYGSFSEKLQDEGWLDAISHVVYWFTRAETNNVGPDGACILLQAALERLAWHVLVRDRSAISERGFEKLTAADQLRLMLNILSIPVAIPKDLTKLQALGRSRALDGPEVFTYIRNRLTHPPKVSASKELLPYYEAYCLAQWYVELAILSACGYGGEYGNRTTRERWKGQVEKVPWA